MNSFSSPWILFKGFPFKTDWSDQDQPLKKRDFVKKESSPVHSPLIAFCIFPLCSNLSVSPFTKQASVLLLVVTLPFSLCCVVKVVQVWMNKNDQFKFVDMIVGQNASSGVREVGHLSTWTYFDRGSKRPRCVLHHSLRWYLSGSHDHHKVLYLFHKVTPHNTKGLDSCSKYNS